MTTTTQQNFPEMWNGWFGFPLAYDYAITHAKNQDNFLEIGAFEGASTAYMSKLIEQSGKNVRFYVVDTWNTDIRAGGIETLPKNRYGVGNNDIYPTFEHNLKKHGYFDCIIPLKMDSKQAYHYLANQGVQFKFIFLDGDHSYENVKWELENYLTLLVPGGIIGGDDYGLTRSTTGVQQAVHDVIGQKNILFSGDFYRSWFYQKP